MKRKLLILLGIILLINGKGFSQNVTNKVVIDTIIAKKIAIDLIAGDFCKKEVDLLKLNIKELEKKVSVKDSMIKNRQVKIENLNTIIKQKDDLFFKQEEISKTYLNELRKSKRTILFYKIFAFVGVTSTGYFILTK